ncbi:hypothetical protein CSA37_06855 [Candidatus Fermentibacteria bacterium]|nr:MAG: hypothetical protein CSA37_06855 [Candidatus Fermentibacteria bacterium]
MKNPLELILSIHGALFTLVLVLLRYFSGLADPFIQNTIQGLLFGTALLTLTAVFVFTGSRRDFRRRPWQLVLSVIFLAAVILLYLKGRHTGQFHNWTIGYAVNGYLSATAFVSISSFLMELTGKSSPALLLPATFILVIIVGTVLLMAPNATPDQGISILDAAFTATSATCVTGLIVVDTEHDFTTIGQLVILALIQVGGLGLMTFAAFFTMTLGQNVGLSGTMNLSRLMDSEFASDIKHILGSILIWTFTIESIGALLLFNTWSEMTELGWSTRETIWQSVFHSVSAFCNAGFSLNETNLEQFQHSPATGLIIGFLIILGGLGFMLLTTMGRAWLTRMKTGSSRPMPVQARFVLLITLILIAGALVTFLAFEWNNTLAGMNLWEKLGNGFLEAVSPRTAGFNTVPTANILPQVKWLFIILMFIGASPGGTGGGVKTTSIGLLFLSIRSLLRKSKNPEIWKRRIPIFDLQRAGAVILLGMVAFALSSMILLSVERVPEGFSDMDYIFEAMSAFGTVGLSTGITGLLSPAGKVVIIITMLVGRTAPATLAAATIRVRKAKYKYPEARITIG